MSPLICQVLEGRFIEPFLGAGAMFFAVAPRLATLGDLNGDLINAYRQVAAHGSQIESELAAIGVDSETYYRMRSAKPKSVLQRAVRFIYLNRTCFGGIHRTNKKGEFNVPYGGGSRTPEPVYRDHLLQAAGRILRRKGVGLVAGDFEPLVDSADAGDVVFCDPTYRAGGRGQFDRYGPRVFCWDDQIRLFQAALRAKNRGATVIVMNVDAPEVELLYKQAIVVKVAKSKSIGNRAASENSHRELISILDPKDRQQHWAALKQGQLVVAAHAIAGKIPVRHRKDRADPRCGHAHRAEGGSWDEFSVASLSL